MLNVSAILFAEPVHRTLAAGSRGFTSFPRLAAKRTNFTLLSVSHAQHRTVVIENRHNPS
jgi:hypothetical protein